MPKKLALVITVLGLIVVSYRYIDRPVVNFWLDYHSRESWVFPKMAKLIPDALVALIAVLYLCVGVRGQKAFGSVTCQRLLLVSKACVITLFLKEVLKGLFGRSWTDTFVCNNPSYLKDQVYGFHWFQFNPTFASFPSGHTALATAFAVSMSLVYPAWRWLWALLALIVALGQIFSYYHFVSDVIAGAALGWWVAWCNHRFKHPPVGT